MRPHPAPAHFYTCWKFPCTKRQVSAFNSTRLGFRLTMAKKRSRTPQPPPPPRFPRGASRPLPPLPPRGPHRDHAARGCREGPGKGTGGRKAAGGGGAAEPALKRPQLGRPAPTRHACNSRGLDGRPGRRARIRVRPAAAGVDGQRAARSGMGMELHYNPLPKPSQHCSKPRLVLRRPGAVLAGCSAPSARAPRDTDGELLATGEVRLKRK